MTDVSWDRDLSPAEVIRLSPDAAAKRCRTSFVRKIEFLEKLAESPVGHLQLDPIHYKNRTALRRWNDPSLRLWRWSDPKVDGKDGKYPDLYTRWENATSVLDDQRQGKQHKLRSIIKQKDLIIQSLEGQILDLMAQLKAAQQKIVSSDLETR